MCQPGLSGLSCSILLYWFLGLSGLSCCTLFRWLQFGQTAYKVIVLSFSDPHMEGGLHS